jgi:hypothetical protein
MLIALCTGATVLALWPALRSDRLRHLPLPPGRDADSTEEILGPRAEPALGADPTATSADAPRDSTGSRALVAADADGDETASARERGRATDEPEVSSNSVRRVAGSIRGSFLREGGPWTAGNVPAENTVILDLSSIAHPTEPAVRAVTKLAPGENGAIAWTFEFADVPEGEYLLTLSALGTRRWSPTSLRVRAPLDGVVFTRFDRDPVITLAFEVVDARDGTPLPEFDARHIQVTPSAENGVFLHTGPLDLAAFPLDARFQWSLRVEGYATAFGDETAFERRGERRVAVVRLSPGWSTKVFVLTRDPTASPARGAEVRLDGLRAGFTGSDGMLVVAALGEPQKIDVKLPGFVRREGPASSGAYTARQRGGVTVVLLDREP